MHFRNFVLFCFALAAVVNQAAYADKEDASEELMEDHLSAEVDLNSTMDTGPPDSHEAMNNREYKPHLALSAVTNNREKRSFKFLLGLVNNNSRLQVADTEEDVDAVTTAVRKTTVTSNDIGASELLLELLVKIAAHPDQWEQVHNLLQKIDKDLKTSKKIFNQMQTAKVNDEDKIPKIEVNKKEGAPHRDVTTETKLAVDRKSTTPIPETSTNDQTNSSVVVLKSNDWRYPRNHNQPDTSTTKYPWEIPAKSIKNEKYPRNFAYHRVTGNPAYHTNMDNNPKAYIAVSVIAPKQMEERRPNDELLLENELRELKPWTHNQNLKNMASLRSRWVIQSDNKNKPTYTP